MILEMPSKSENLKRLLGERHRSASWLAKQLGLPSRQSAYDWLEGTEPRTPAVWARIADVLGVDLSEIDETAKSIDRNAVQSEAPRREPLLNLVPYWGNVPCGNWEAPIGDPELIEISDRIEDTDGVVAVRVQGDSMAPRLVDRQLVAIKRSTERKDGVITLFKNGDGELTLKVLRYTPRGWELHSINPEYGIASAESVDVLGYAIAFEEVDPTGIRA